MTIDNATPDEWNAALKAAAHVCQPELTPLDMLNAKLDRPFGEVPLEVRCMAFALWQQGHPVQSQTDEFDAVGSAPRWVNATRPQWTETRRYRILAKPEELVVPSIDWSHVALKWTWLAQDEDGQLWLYQARPEVSLESRWWFVAGGKNSENHEASEFASATRGKGDWTKLISQRPEGV